MTEAEIKVLSIFTRELQFEKFTMTFLLDTQLLLAQVVSKVASAARVFCAHLFSFVSID